MRKLLTKRNIIIATLALILIIAAAIAYQFLHKDYKIYHSKNIALDNGAATYVLVPGGGHGAWCYKQVGTILNDAGQTVHAVALPGLASVLMN